jgi:uncharacterized protein (TIGR04168 family)
MFLLECSYLSAVTQQTNPHTVELNMAFQLMWLQVPGKPLSVIGARPFSKGGSSWSSIAPFMQALYHVGSMEQSGQLIAEAGAKQPEGHSLIFLSHNAPTGMTQQTQQRAIALEDPPMQIYCRNLRFLPLIPGLGSERSSIAGVDW